MFLGNENSHVWFKMNKKKLHVSMSKWAPIFLIVTRASFCDALYILWQQILHYKIT